MKMVMLRLILLVALLVNCCAHGEFREVVSNTKCVENVIFVFDGKEWSWYTDCSLVGRACYETHDGARCL